EADSPNVLAKEYFLQILGYAREIIAEKRNNPQDDILSTIVRARLDEEVLPLLTDRLPLMLGRYARLRSRPDHPRIRVRIILTDPARNFLLDWRGPESRAAIDDGGPVAATLTGQSEIFVRLVGGRAGSFHVLGDAAAGNALAEVLFRPLKYL
ncbi:MAG: hypothetical protein QGG90_09005, partial [Nitrospinota bacterium]|nr:hypothetical protein [Nitrospinota bacterium]